MAKQVSILDAAKLVLRFVQNFDKIKKNTVDIFKTVGSVVPKKKDNGITVREVETKEEGENASLVKSALTNMGYKAGQAQKAVSSIEDIENKSLQDSVKEAIKLLAVKN